MIRGLDTIAYAFELTIVENILIMIFCVIDIITYAFVEDINAATGK